MRVRSMLLYCFLLLCTACGDAGCSGSRGADEGERNQLGAFDRPTLPSNEQCRYGTEGCPCLPGMQCADGLSCFGDYCYGDKVRAPDTYFYKKRQFDDVHTLRKLVLKHLQLREGMVVADLGAGDGGKVRRRAEGAVGGLDEAAQRVLGDQGEPDEELTGSLDGLVVDLPAVAQEDRVFDVGIDDVLAGGAAAPASRRVRHRARQSIIF